MFSADRNLLALQTDSPPHETPFDVIVELVIVMVLGLVGSLLVIGKLPLLVSAVAEPSRYVMSRVLFFKPHATCCVVVEYAGRQCTPSTAGCLVSNRC